LADVGLVGFPNAGKSTLLSSMTAAKPKIADYAFTTLTPQLGMVEYRDGRSFCIADLPGIIEGAAEGKGLGHRFLRHIERNPVLLFLIPADSKDHKEEWNILLNELEQYNPELLDKKFIIAISKSDMLDDELKQAIAKDPAGVMADLSTILTAGATLPTRVAPALATAARAVDPLMLSAKALGKTAELGGAATKQALGLTTGVGGEPIAQAYKAGLVGGEAGEALKANMRGNVEQTAVLDAAKQNIAELGRQRQQAYRANMENIKGDKSVLDFAGIDKALSDAQSKVVFKGKIKNEAAAQKLAEVEAKVAEWKSFDPKDFHTPEGLDALKQSIGETLESIPFESTQQRLVVGEVYNAVKNEINKQAPTYAKTMKAYADASEQIKEIEKALSLGKKASVDTAMRKLQSLMRNNVNTNYGQRLRLAQELEATGGRQLMPSLAGQALNQITPRGIQGATSIPTSLGAFSLGGLPLTLAYGGVSSPRLVGEAAYGAGRVAKGLLDVQNKLPALDYPTMFNLLYQANQPKD